MKKNTIGIGYTIGYILFFLSIFICIDHCQQKKIEKKFEEAGTYVIGTITKVKRRSADFQFEYRNKMYRGVADSREVRYSDIGNRFFVKTCSTDLSISIIFMDHSVPDCIRHAPPEGWSEIPSDCNVVGGFLRDNKVSFDYDIHRLEIYSLFREDADDTLSSPYFFPQPVVRQELSFFKAEKLTQKIQFPSDIITEKLSNQEICEMNDIVLKKVSIIKGGAGFLYLLEGYGGCSENCSSMKAYYNNVGDLLYLEKIKNGKTQKSQGDKDKMLLDFQIDKNYRILKKIITYPFKI
jgi:hypothetical protein